MTVECPEYCERAAELMPHTHEEKVVEIALCEVDWIFLRPNQLYRFVPIPGCELCHGLAAQYMSGE